MIGEILLSVFKIVAWYLQARGASKEEKSEFFEFVRQAGEDYSIAKLMEYGDLQIKQLKDTPWDETK